MSRPPPAFGEDAVAIGDGRFAHFRRDRRYARVQVAFTAPEGIDPDPGRELTGRFEEQGWRWRPHEPGRPWVFRLDRPSAHDPTARGDSRDVLHEQFLLIIDEHRQRHGLPPVTGRQQCAGGEKKGQDADQIGTDEDKTPRTEEETRGGVGASGADAGQALQMLEAFASVGAQRFDLTLTDAAGQKAGFRGGLPLDQLRASVAGVLQAAAERRHNVIVRPRPSAESAALIQLDDLGEDAAQRLRPVSFLVQRTSPDNYQAWVAVGDAGAGDDADFARRLRRGTGADLTASGATRVSGSMNFKEKYAPDYPRVETAHARPGRVVERAELEALGVVAPAESVHTTRASQPRRSHAAARGWPSYQRCLQNAPPARGGSGRQDRSKADYTFCLLAIDWGWSAEEAAGRLMQESSKAQEEGEKYALRTASAAATAVERRGERRR